MNLPLFTRGPLGEIAPNVAQSHKIAYLHPKSPYITDDVQFQVLKFHKRSIQIERSGWSKVTL